MKYHFKPLHFAAINDYIGIVDYLMNSGANINARNKETGYRVF